MDPDIVKFEENLSNARQEWRRLKYLQNGDERKQACHLRLKEAEHALKLFGKKEISIDVKKEMIEGNSLITDPGNGKGSRPEDAMDVDAMFPEQDLGVNGSNSVPERRMDVDSVVIHKGFGTTSNANPEPSVPVNTTETTKDNAVPAKPSKAATLAQNDQSMGAPESNVNLPIPITNEPIDESNLENGMDVDAIPLTHEMDTNSSNAMSGPIIGVDPPVSIAAEAGPQAPKDTHAHGTSEPSSPRSQSAHSNADQALDKSLTQENSTTINRPHALPQSQDAAASDDTAPDASHDHEAPPGGIGLSIESPPSQGAEPITGTDADSLPLAHDASVGVNRSSSHPEDLVPSINEIFGTAPAHGTAGAKRDPLKHVGAPQDLDNALSSSETDGPIPALDKSASIHHTPPSANAQLTYRIINHTFTPQKPPKENLSQQAKWAMEDQYADTKDIADDLLSIASLNDKTLNVYDPINDMTLWTMPDEDIEHQDVEKIAPYSQSGTLQAVAGHSSDTAALQAFKAELDELIATKPKIISPRFQYTFKIGDIDWERPIPSYTRVIGDSDSEHRVRGEFYAAKAAWMFASAHSDWIQRQKDMFQETANKGIPDVSAFMAAWSACESDVEELSLRAGTAKATMVSAQRAMDACFKGKSRAIVEFSIEELQAKILSDDDIHPDDLHLLRNKLIAKKEELREILKYADEQDAEGSDSDERPSGKGHNDIAYERMDEEGQAKCERKARVAFHKFAKLAAASLPNLGRLKAAASGFNLTYRRAARTICGFLPEAGTTSRSSALLCLTTSPLNILCRTHHMRHSASKCDSVTHFRGVAYSKSLSARGTGIKDPRTPEPNHMHCGCLIDDALLEFFFWKTVTARSTNPLLSGVVHNMNGEVTPFLLRSFWVSQFKSTTGLTLDDIYNLNADEASHQTSLIAKMVQRHIYKLRHHLGIRVSLKFETDEDKDTFLAITGGDVNEV